MKRIVLSAISVLFSVSLLFLSGCSDDTEFSSSPSYRLDFSCDTVSFDTLFTTIGSSTQVFQIYNRNDVSLSIASIEQMNAAESGFRVNVDGQFATHFNDVEIRDNDSLYVFVEVTVNPQNQDGPMLIADSLIFTLQSGVRQSVKLIAYGQDVIILHAPHFTVDDTLHAVRPYLIYDSLTVDSGVLLTIEAGARLHFHKDAVCNIRGTINATGTLESPIVFRGDRTDNMFDYLPYDHIPGQWGGIRLFTSSYNNNFVFCDIHSANFGIRCDSSDLSLLKMNLESSIIHNVEGDGLSMTLCVANVANCLLTNAGGNCVNILGGVADFVHCTIANFYVWDQKGVAAGIYNIKDDFLYPLFGVNFYNCLITGSTNDEILGAVAEKSDSVDYSEYAQYQFTYSLINSSDEGNEHFTHIVWDRDSCEIYGKANFKLIDHDNFLYDFQLDSLSTAIGIANPEYAVYYPTDLLGNSRTADGAPDAGCYEYVAKE